MNKIRRVLMIVVSCLTVTMVLSAQQPKTQVSGMSYELYSWRGANGEWRFCILPSPSGRSIYAEEVFNSKFALHGVDDLERKITELPKGASVLWLDRILSTQGRKPKKNESLTYPPSETIRQIQRYAERHGIKVELGLRENGAS